MDFKVIKTPEVKSFGGIPDLDWVSGSEKTPISNILIAPDLHWVSGSEKL
jgi:hypothetical protein